MEISVSLGNELSLCVHNATGCFETFFSGRTSDQSPLVLDLPLIIGVVDLYCIILAKKRHFPAFFSLHNYKSLGPHQAFCRGCDRRKWSNSHFIYAKVSAGHKVLSQPTTCCHMLNLICWLTSSSCCISAFSFSDSWARHVLSFVRLGASLSSRIPPLSELELGDSASIQ